MKGPNNGFGRVYNYWINNDYHPVVAGYDSISMPSIKQTSRYFTKKYSPRAEESWSTLILNKSQAFSHPEVEWLNESMRTYVWLVQGGNEFSLIHAL